MQIKNTSLVQVYWKEVPLFWTQSDRLYGKFQADAPLSLLPPGFHSLGVFCYNVRNNTLSILSTVSNDHVPMAPLNPNYVGSECQADRS